MKKIEFFQLNKLLPETLVGLKVLDLGCGNGFITEKFARKGGKFFGLDLNQNQIKQAKAKHPNIQFVCAPANKIPFPAEFFDVVIANSAIEHFDFWSECVTEIGRVLKPNGLFVASTETKSFCLTKKQVNKKIEVMQIKQFFSRKKIRKDFLGFKLLKAENYVSGWRIKLYNFITLNKFPKWCNVGVSAPLHKLLSPLLALISNNTGKERDCMGLAVKLKKK